MPGNAVLAKGGSALDAVEAAIVVMEEAPQFNAGKGAVFNAEGKHELDASIMEGHTRRAGAVAGISTVRNPIRLARAVMEHSPHVMMAGAGAEKFADSRPEIERVANSWFDTERRRQQLEAEQAKEKAGAGLVEKGKYFGTVGAVALDAQGHIAAATSTGGMTNKRWGRIGDSPVIGAGTWADDRCGVSGTGWGEFYIRNAVAHDICARVAYRGDALGGGRGGSGQQDRAGEWRRRRCDRAGPRRQHRDAVQHHRHVPGLDQAGWIAWHRDLPRRGLIHRGWEHPGPHPDGSCGPPVSARHPGPCCKGRQGRDWGPCGRIRVLDGGFTAASPGPVRGRPEHRATCPFFHPQPSRSAAMADAFGHLPRHPSRILKAAKWSMQGLHAAWLHESSFRLEVYLFVVLAPIGWWLGQTPVERILLIGSMLLVLSTELLNSAIEAVIERYGPEFHELAGRAKDMGSAAVFVLMMNVLLVWGAILLPRVL
jgi:isoaspartyl peptidase/L-asparaginase-like protein (Ntn-hydrolase superfamily)/diacylglycerol kinase